MAGHSKFKNIMHRKGAQDKKRAKVFSRLGREISVAVKVGGDDPESNIRLRSAIASAKGLNMPKDNIERAIKKGQGNDPESNYEEVRYEGYGPEGVAIIVEALTNNKNRTAAEIRSTFSKYGGNLGETGSVSFSFERLGNISLNKSLVKEEDLFEFLIENETDDYDVSDDEYVIYCYKITILKCFSKYSITKNDLILFRFNLLNEIYVRISINYCLCGTIKQFILP